MTCRCGHARAYHQHLRRGSDCSTCDCPRYRWGLLRAVWEAWDTGTGRGEVADAPELPPCGMRIVLTEEQVTAAIAEMEQHFPKTKDRRIR